MSDFSVTISTLKAGGERICDTGGIVKQISDLIPEISSGLKATSIDIDGNLSMITAKLAKARLALQTLGAVAIEASAIYNEAEETIQEQPNVNMFGEWDVMDTVMMGNDYTVIRTSGTVGGNSIPGYKTEEEHFAENFEYEYSSDNIRVPICVEFLDKKYCMAMAEQIIADYGSNGKCNNMNARRIAKEIYAHALGYYFASELQDIGIDGDFIQGMIESGEVADVGLGDGLELHYNILWYWMAPFDLGPTYF